MENDRFSSGGSRPLGLDAFNAYEGSESFYSTKTTQNPAIFDKF